MKAAIRLWLIALTALVAPLPAPSAQVTITASADTSLWQREVDHNLGGSDILPLGTTGVDGPGKKSRLLLKFDIATALPANAVIQSASLFLHVVIAPMANAENSTFDAFPVLNDWGEGNKTYTDPQKPMNSTQAATAGEATWNYRFHADENQRWIAPGGALNDQDFSEDISLEFFMQSDANRDYNVALNPSGLGALQNWLANPAANFGWVFVSRKEAFLYTGRQIASRENATPSFRPKLTIVYTSSQPNPPQIQSITRNGNNLTVRFTAQANVVYRPQRRPTVNSGQWFDLPDLGPIVSAGQLEFSENVTGVDERYYRVIIP